LLIDLDGTLIHKKIEGIDYSNKILYLDHIITVKKKVIINN